MIVTKINGTLLSALGATVYELPGLEDVNFIRSSADPRVDNLGAILLNQKIEDRVFSIKGAIAGSSANDLDDKLRRLMALCRRNGDSTTNNIEGTMNAETFLIDAYLNGFQGERRRDTSTFMKYTAQFIAPNPVLYRSASITTTIKNPYTGANAANLNVNVSGTYRPRVKIILTLTHNDTGGTVTIVDEQTGDTLQFERLDQGGVTNTITIDCHEKTILQDDGTDQTYLDSSGRFPRFELNTAISVATQQIKMSISDSETVAGTAQVEYVRQWL